MKIFQSFLAVLAIASASATERGGNRLRASRGSRSSDSSSSSSKKGGRSPMEDLRTTTISASGAQEVPPVDSATSAQLTFDVSDDLSSIDFMLEVQNGIDISQAHLHCAPAGVNGPVLVFLFPLVANGGGVDGDGTLNKGTLTNADLLNVECEGIAVGNIATLVEFILQRRVYLNVHSLANPSGEVRGQVIVSQH